MDKHKLIFTYGRITAFAVQLTECADVLQAVKIFPIEDEIIDICKQYDEIYFFEESEKSGGISEKICSILMQSGYNGKVTITAAEGFMPHMTVERQLERASLDYNGMKSIIGEQT